MSDLLLGKETIYSGLYNPHILYPIARNINRQHIISDETPFFGFDNSYARLPEHFYARLSPTPVAAPALVRVNRDLALALKLDPDFLASPEGVQILSGNALPADAEPLAMAYAGFQFGGWSPQLGDGRAILLGEVVGDDGIRRNGCFGH